MTLVDELSITPEDRDRLRLIRQTDPDFRLRCVEIAERTVYYSRGRGNSPSGVQYAEPEDKPMREVFDRADRIAQYCLNADVPAGLIDRLRAALCAKD